MSDAAGMLPTVRLLEPRALVAADRAAARIQDRSASLLRNIDGGALRFAARMFNYWLGAPASERAPSAQAARGPASLEYARPWYETPRSWPRKGIVLGGTAPRAAPLAAPRGPIADMRAFELVSTYAPTEASDVAPAVAGRPARGAPVALAARLAQQLVRADQLLHADEPLAPESRSREVQPFARVHVEPAQPGTPVGGAAAEALAPIAAGAGSAALGLRPALQHALPMAWPRVQRFIEQLAGPMALAQAGQLAPLEVDSIAPLRGDTIRPIAPFTRELIAPLGRAAREGRLEGTPRPVAEPRLPDAATSAGELARQNPPPALGLPGRIAQHAELLAAVAERRVDRQLGRPQVEHPRSVRWSADAFTVLSLATGAGVPEAQAPAPVARPDADRPAPRSSASLLAFTDAQIGPRLVAATRSLPVFAPSAVYVADAPRAERAAGVPLVPPVLRALPVRPGARPAGGGQASLEIGSPPREDVARAQPVGFAAGMGDGPVAAPSRGFAIGQLGLRSEQLAGTLGLRAASLASEFLFDTDADAAAAGGALADPVVARAAQRGWLSTNEWALLSLFPSQVTAQQIAHRVGGPSREPGSLIARAADRGALAAREVPAAPMTMLLPDGRRPRGSQIVARMATPTLSRAETGAPPSLLAGAEAAERRVDAPVGGPLWGHLPVVAPAAGELGRTSSAGPTSARAPTGAGALPRELAAPRSVALELLAPYVDAAPSAPTGASSFARGSSPPPVSARSSDDATRSLVTALQASSSQSGNDRLSMADMTLISIVAGTEQVAAAQAGSSIQPASPKQAARAPSQQGGGGAAHDHDEDEEDMIAYRVLRRFINELRQLQHNSGKGQEK